MTVHRGTILRWESGWGFVQDDSSLVSYFVHMHSIEGAVRLCLGDKVEFTLERTKSKRTQAVHVRKLNGEAPKCL